jgi:hypothetical protein
MKASSGIMSFHMFAYFCPETAPLCSTEICVAGLCYEPISAACFTNSSCHCVSVCVFIVARKRLGKNFTAVSNTDATVEFCVIDWKSVRRTENELWAGSMFHHALQLL